MNDEYYMNIAIDLAKKAVLNGNEPFGALLVKDDKIVFTSENQIYSKNDPTYHAEMGLFREFVPKSGITSLEDYTLYSSCEPCFMCSGAMVWLKLGRLVYGASNKDLENILGNEKGCECSSMVFDNSFSNISITKYVLREKSIEVLKDYFSIHKKG